MKRSEADWQTVWNQYLREKKYYGFFELKATQLKSLAFSKIEIGQYDGLQATEQSGLVWKLSDQDQRQKPCDTISAPPLPSYIVIKFSDAFYSIRIEEIVKLREAGGIAITWEQAKKVAEKIVYV